MPYALYFLFFRIAPLHHAEKEENTEWMWAVEKAPPQEVVGQMAVVWGAGRPMEKLQLCRLL